MGTPVLIFGDSGLGKSSSLRTFDPDQIGLINVESKQLPFRGRFSLTLESDNFGEITTALNQCEKSSIVVDDAGYLLVNMFMSGHSKYGAGNAIFAFYNKIADSFWSLIQAVKALPKSKLVYFIMHEEQTEFGQIKPKTLGRLLDKHVNIPGLFTIVFRAVKEKGGYYFSTQSNGLDCAKTPFEMFSELLIPNDLAMIDKTIREYYKL